ncbi:MAG: ABC transporter ATP-binding protein, partial [Catenulispora sp.]|nr:ABC transporter ATP-binding protein [Catenulispora sp.]
MVAPAVLAAVLTVGGVELSAGRISPGDLFAASRYTTLGLGLGGITAVYGTVARSRAAVSRVAEVLALRPFPYGTFGATDVTGTSETSETSETSDAADTPDATGTEGPATGGTGRLEFRSVSVPGVLDDLSFEIPGGAVVAVVGASGAGKSTLAELVVRLRDPDSGEILLDGVPLRQLSHAALREAVGCAFERPGLVGRTDA